MAIDTKTNLYIQEFLAISHHLWAHKELWVISFMLHITAFFVEAQCFREPKCRLPWSCTPTKKAKCSTCFWGTLQVNWIHSSSLSTERAIHSFCMLFGWQEYMMFLRRYCQNTSKWAKFWFYPLITCQAGHSCSWSWITMQNLICTFPKTP